MRLDQLFHHRQVGASLASRHRSQAHAGLGEAGVFHGPAGFVNQHHIARLQQGAGDEVQRLRGAYGGDDLARRRLHADFVQALGQGLAQARLARRVAITQGRGRQGRLGQHAAQGLVQQRQIQPFGRQGAQAGHGPAALALEHAADQRRGGGGLRGGVRCGGLQGGDRGSAAGRRGVAHKVAALRARLHQAAGEQAIVGRHHGAWAHRVFGRAFTH